MADTKTLYRIENDQPGPRGIWSDGMLSYVEPGSFVLAELTDDDKKMADKSGYFSISKATAADKKALETPAPAPVEDTPVT